MISGVGRMPLLPRAVGNTGAVGGVGMSIVRGFGLSCLMGMLSEGWLV